MVNFSFARMRKKYIEDNDEQDPALIEKVAPFYRRTSQIIGGTQVSFVLCSAMLGISLLMLVSHALVLLESLLGGELWAAGSSTALPSVSLRASPLSSASLLSTSSAVRLRRRKKSPKPLLRKRKGDW